MPVTEGLRTIIVGFLAIGAGFTWLAVRTAWFPMQSPERLIAELRLAQIGALLLVLLAAPYIGMAVVFDSQLGVGFDVALAIGFFGVAAVTLVHEPRMALTILAFAFAAHAVLDIAHRPGWLLPEGLAPRWYSLGCAIYGVYIGALCYLPALKRS